MMHPAKQAKLQAFLTALPPQHAARLLAACDAAEAHGQSAGLPVQLLREALGGRVDRAVERFLGPAMPLVADVRGPKQPGRIARASITPIMQFCEALAPEAYSAVASGDDDLLAHRETLGRALQTALRDPGAETRLQGRLGGLRGFHDALDMAALFCAEPELSNGLGKYPDIIEDLDEKCVRRLSILYDIVLNKDRGAPLLLVFLILHRLKKRSQILRLLKRLAGREDDVMATQTDISAIGDLLLDDADAAVASLVTPVIGAPDGPGVASALGRFDAISRGMTRELGIRRDGKWGQRLKDLRYRAARNMDVLCSAAPKAIDAALPLERISLGGAAPAMRPAIGVHAHEETIARGYHFAVILGSAGQHATSCGFATEYAKAKESAERIVDHYCDGLIEQLQHASDQMLPAVEAWQALAEDMLSVLVDERSTEVFRRRAAAALAARTRARVA